MQNNNLPRQPVDLSGGGESWNGWSFAPYGRAREFRLIGPDGATYSAQEIADLRRIGPDLDFLRGRLREIEDREAVYFSAAELRELNIAAGILARLRARPARRRMPPALRAVK